MLSYGSAVRTEAPCAVCRVASKMISNDRIRDNLILRAVSKISYEEANVGDARVGGNQ
jgi:hypothetical protein